MTTCGLPQRQARRSSRPGTCCHEVPSTDASTRSYRRVKTRRSTDASNVGPSRPCSRTRLDGSRQARGHVGLDRLMKRMEPIGTPGLPSAGQNTSDHAIWHVGWQLARQLATHLTPSVGAPLARHAARADGGREVAHLDRRSRGVRLDSTLVRRALRLICNLCGRSPHRSGTSRLVRGARAKEAWTSTKVLSSAQLHPPAAHYLRYARRVGSHQVASYELRQLPCCQLSLQPGHVVSSQMRLQSHPWPRRWSRAATRSAARTSPDRGRRMLVYQSVRLN